MRQPGGELVKSSASWPGHSRRYSPFDRAPGLRRVPDEPVGLAILSSLVLHAVLVLALVRLTDAPPETPGADVSAILVDLAGSATAVTAPPRAPGATVKTPPPAVPSRPPAASTPTAARQPVSAPPAAVATPKATVGPGEDWAAAPSGPSSVSSVAPPPPAEDGIAFIPAPTGASGIPEPSVSSALTADLPLDAGWPGAPPPALASASLTKPARTLIPVPLLQDPSRGAPQPIPPPRAIAEPVLTAAEPPERPAPTPAPAAPAADPPKVTAPSPPSLEASEQTTIPGTAPPAEPSPKSAARATPPATPPSTVAQTPVPPASSPFGLSLGRTLVRLDGPRAWATDQPTPTVSGRILGAAHERLVLYVNGAPADVSQSGRAFEASVSLRPGANELRAVVTGLDGLEAEDAITVQYAAPAASSAIALTSPPDGLTLGPDDPPVVVVEGEIGDKAPATVWIVANDRRIPVAASGGRFRHVLLLPDPLVRLWAETTDGDAVRRSAAVTVRTAGARPSAGVLVMQWPTGTEGTSVEISATWRAHPERLDGPVRTVRLPGAATTADGSPPDIFFLRGLAPGVHTLIVRYRGGAQLGDARPTLYLPNSDHLTSRSLQPVSLNGAGRRVVTKILMPQAILWEQDEWFSGRSESVDTVTKFRIPDGISWVERKGNLP